MSTCSLLEDPGLVRAVRGELDHGPTNNEAVAEATEVRFSGAARRALCILLTLIAGASMWIYVLTMWPGYLEKLSDLYPRWYGARELLLHHRDPYSQDVSQEIQYWIFGRLAGPAEDQGRFAYPVYVSFLLWPTIYSNFSSANAFMFWLLLLLGAASALGFARFVGWPRSQYGLFLLVLLCACSYPVVFAARLRQLSLLVAFLLATALVLLSRNKLLPAGALLALATIKPQLMVLLAPWLLLWTLADWSRRQRLFWSFTISLALLSAASEILVPGWISEFARSVSSYAHYTHAASILDFLLSGQIGIIATVVLVGFLAFQCWQLRSCEANSSQFIFGTALVLAVTLVVIPTLAPHGQILLVPGILVLLKSGVTLWKGARRHRDALLGACMIAGWPWLGAVAFSAVFLLGFGFERRLWLLPVSTIPLAPLAITLALLLCRKPILQ
ncbi:MAG TPA: glycosyltransferase 87 family protein [Terriglobales bacterium]|nr:glycosyltransferase 87 family protein [Terriglobales bacterium]